MVGSFCWNSLQRNAEILPQTHIHTQSPTPTPNTKCQMHMSNCPKYAATNKPTDHSISVHVFFGPTRTHEHPNAPARPLAVATTQRQSQASAGKICAILQMCCCLSCGLQRFLPPTKHPVSVRHAPKSRTCTGAPCHPHRTDHRRCWPVGCTCSGGSRATGRPFKFCKKWQVMDLFCVSFQMQCRNTCTMKSRVQCGIGVESPQELEL